MPGVQSEIRESREFHLSFFFGDLRFYTRHFPAIVVRTPFNPDMEARDIPQPYFELFPSGIEAMFYRGIPISASLPTITNEKRWIRYVPRQLDHYYTDLRGTFEDYLKKFSKKTRSELRRQLKVFTKFCDGELDFRVYKTPSEMEEFQQLARALALKTYQERLFQGALPDTEKFKARTKALAHQDLVRGFLLFHSGVPVAYLYGAGSLGYIDYVFLGYDPQYKQWSPGTLLQYLVLEKLFEEKRFTFYYWGYGEGEATSKVFFSTGRAMCADIYYFRPTLPNLLTAYVHRATSLLSKGTGEALNKVHLRRTLRRIIRRSPPAKMPVLRAG